MQSQGNLSIEYFNEPILGERTIWYSHQHDIAYLVENGTVEQLKEFNWSRRRIGTDLEALKKYAINMLYSGDGARVKKVRIIKEETGEVVFRK